VIFFLNLCYAVLICSLVFSLMFVSSVDLSSVLCFCLICCARFSFLHLFHKQSRCTCLSVFVAKFFMLPFSITFVYDHFGSCGRSLFFVSHFWVLA